MKLIVQKSVRYSVQDFFQTVINLDYLDGISLNVFKTKDDILVTFNLILNSEPLLQSISSSTFNEIQNLEIIRLDTVISYLSSISYKKKVYLNLVPFKDLQLNEEQNKKAMLEFDLYTTNLLKIINNSGLNIYIHSVSRDLLDILKSKKGSFTLGFVISGYDLTYIDVSYYVFSYQVLDLLLVKQEIDLDKEVIIYLDSDYAMSKLYELLFDSKNKVGTKVKNNISLMGNYPELMKKTFLS